MNANFFMSIKRKRKESTAEADCIVSRFAGILSLTNISVQVTEAMALVRLKHKETSTTKPLTAQMVGVKHRYTNFGIP